MVPTFIGTVLLSIATFFPVSSGAQAVAKDCSKPSVLHITKPGNDLYFQLDKNPRHSVFSLDEVADATRCSPEKMIFVVATPSITLREMRLPSKLQLTRVRYFVQYGDGELWELSFGSIFPKLPITSDVIGRQQLRRGGTFTTAPHSRELTPTIMHKAI